MKSSTGDLATMILIKANAPGSFVIWHVYSIITILLYNARDILSLRLILGRYCSASARCAGAIFSLPAKSAIVRASLSTR